MSTASFSPASHNLVATPDQVTAFDSTQDYGPWKAAGDGAAALVLLSLAAPLMLVLMVLVRLTSAGPSVYAQTRLGRNGRPFRIYKLRSMFHDCERSTGPRWAARRDPRVTPLGRFLRRSHLDELPQLWNVLRGDMAIVGPRPERPEFATQLEKAIPEYRERLKVRPGITGLAQVQLPADEDLEGVRRKVACDLRYIERMGPWLDARIVAATALKVAGAPFEMIGRMLALPGVAGVLAATGRQDGLEEPAHSRLQTA